MAKRKLAKKQLKPEYSIKVVAKKSPKQQVVKPAQKKQTKKRSYASFWLKKSRAKKIRFIFIAVLLLIIGIGFCATGLSIVRTNDALNSASKAGDSLSYVTPEDVANARIVGSSEQLMTEIDGYQSAPADLQAYTLKDYRRFKQNCIVNGKIYGSLSYAIAGVADAQYAQIKRNCNGEQTQILKKFGDTWTVVHEGNNPPLCSLVNDLMIPQRVSLNCRQGGTMYLNPNP